VTVETRLWELRDLATGCLPPPEAIRARASRRRRRRRLGAIAAAVIAISGAGAAVAAAGRTDETVGVSATVADGAFRVALDDVPDGVSGYDVGGYRFFLVRDGDDVIALRDDAQHLPGERLWWCPNERHFFAPTHGETFDLRGRKIAGPSTRDLDRYTTTIHAGELVVDFTSVERGASRTERALPRPPWNGGPGSYCDGAMTTSGPAASWPPPSVAPTSAPAPVVVDTAAPRPSTTAPPLVRSLAFHDLIATIDFDAPTAVLGERAAFRLTITNPTADFVRSPLPYSLAMRTPSATLLAVRLDPDPSGTALELGPHGSLHFSGSVLLAGEELAPGTMPVQLVYQAHMIVQDVFGGEPTTITILAPAPSTTTPTAD